MISKAPKSFLFIIIVLFNVIIISNCAKYPNELPRCKPGDENCLVQAAQAAFQKVIENKGYRALNVPPVEPLRVNQIDIKQGSDSPVNIQLVLLNIDVTGLPGVKFTKITGFGEEPSGKYEIQFSVPFINLYSDYTIDGKVLILPIVGEGKSNMTVENVEATIKFIGKPVTRNGKVYLESNNIKLTFTTTRLYMHLSNLYKGDKALGDSTNAFLNDNWEDIFNELKVNIFEAFGQVFEQMIGAVFKRFAYNELVLLD